MGESVHAAAAGAASSSWNGPCLLVVLLPASEWEADQRGRGAHIWASTARAPVFPNTRMFMVTPLPPTPWAHAVLWVHGVRQMSLRSADPYRPAVHIRLG